MNETGIIWTEATWNPMSGCQKVSQGCKFCYAESLAENKRGTLAFPNGFDLTIRRHKLLEPARLKQPTLIFTNSMSDLFWDQVPNSYRHEIVDVIEQNPMHEFQVLTKRPEGLLAFSKERKLPPNFWAGVTMESSPAFERRIDFLREVDAEIKFLSVEPMLTCLGDVSFSGLQWVITGGESGTHLCRPEVAEKRSLARQNPKNKQWEPREDRVGWVRNVRDICQRDGVKFFHKQWGGVRPSSSGRSLDGRTWNEFPRLPGTKTMIANEHLAAMELALK